VAINIANLFEHAFDADPRAWRVFVRIVKAALAANRLDLAATFAQRAVTADPKDWCSWDEVSLAYAEFFARQQAKR